MFVNERRKFSGQRIRRKQPTNRRLSVSLTSTSAQNEVTSNVSSPGTDIKNSTAPAPSFIVGFYRPDNSLMAYQGERSQSAKVAQPHESQLRTQSYLKQTIDTENRIICSTGNNMAAYSTRHVHAPKPTVPPKPRVCSRRTAGIEKVYSGQVHQSSGPVLSQALKLERFKTPEYRNLPSATRIHAWVEEQTASERRPTHKQVPKRLENAFSAMEEEFRKVHTDAGGAGNKLSSGNLYSMSHQLLRDNERVHKCSSHQTTTAERSSAALCYHSNEGTNEITDTASLRNACAKWFARDDVAATHQYVASRQSNYVDLSRNIKSTNEPDKVVQKESIGRLHQDATVKRRQTGEDEDKSSSESGRGTMQSGIMGSKHHLDLSLDSDHSVTVWKVQQTASKEESCREPSVSPQTPHTKSHPPTMTQNLLRPKTPSPMLERTLDDKREGICQRSAEVKGQSQGTINHRNNTVKNSLRRCRESLSDLDSTTTALDLESLTLDDGDDITSSLCYDTREMAVIRRQLEGLESMYGEILRLLGVKNRSWKTERNSFEYYRSGRSKRVRGSLSSLTGKSSSTYREKSHHKSERRRSKEAKNGGSTRRLQRLECHVVTLARNVAKLSSEMRTQHHLVRELDALRQDVAWVRDQLQIAQSAPSSIKGHSAKDWETLRNEVLQILNPGRIRKLTKFFGSEPPLLRQFLKRLGYEKYATNFETEKIGIMELPYLNEEKLQKLGIPMGPRLRILQEAHLTFRQNDLKIYIV